MVVSMTSVLVHLLSGRTTLKILRAVPLVILLAVALFALSTVVFEQRLESIGYTPERSMLTSVYAYTVQPNDAVVDAVRQSTALGRRVISSITTFTQYYTHGVFEFGLLATAAQHDEPRLGTASFPPLRNILNRISPSTVGPESSVRTGVFSTFLGPMYLDFKLFVFPLLMVLGALSVQLWFKARQSSALTARAFLSYVNVLLLYAPVVSLIQNALGAYFLGAFFVSSMITWRLGRSKYRVSATVREVSV